MSSENMLIEFLEECVAPEGGINNNNQIKCKNVQSINTLNLSNAPNPNKEESTNKNLKLKHYRGKCAEIFIENGECYVVCEFCDISFKTLEVFVCHIYKRHLIMKNSYHEMFSLQEEQLFAHQVKKQQKRKTNIKSNTPKTNNQCNSTKYVIDFGSKKNNQNLLEVIEGDNSNNSDGYSPRPEYSNPIKRFIINSENNQNSKLICLPASNDKDVVYFDELSINTQNSRMNNGSDELNILPIITEESINYESSYCCDVCNEIFSNTKEYKKHYQKHQNEWKNYTCPICPKSFGSTFLYENEFNLHMKKHLQQQGQKEFCCLHCDKIFIKHIDLLRHIETNHSVFLIENQGSSELFGDALEII